MLAAHTIYSGENFTSSAIWSSALLRGWRKMRLYWLVLSSTVRLWNAFFYRIKVKSPKFQGNLIRTWAMPSAACVLLLYIWAPPLAGGTILLPTHIYLVYSSRMWFGRDPSCCLSPRSFRISTASSRFLIGFCVQVLQNTIQTEKVLQVKIDRRETLFFNKKNVTNIAFFTTCS